MAGQPGQARIVNTDPVLKRSAKEVERIKLGKCVENKVKLRIVEEQGIAIPKTAMPGENVSVRVLRKLTK